ncbi:Uncharacterised protein [Brevibacterium casei]|uniref:Uncharacterized protein n=1 Tax=Brevibacterium casei TaxID=33889 RepID=A0A449D7E0_9MICO|nr:Uncharacterised protein [Brevibacterium casei]
METVTRILIGAVLGISGGFFLAQANGTINGGVVVGVPLILLGMAVMLRGARD